MSWLAVLLSLASLGGSPAPGEVKPRKQCSVQAGHSAAKKCKKAVKPKPKTKPKTKAKPRQAPKTTTPTGQRGDEPATSPGHRADPDAKATPTPTPTPRPGATPVPTPTPTPPPGTTYPSRTNVDLTDVREWAVRPSYRILAAGRIDFNVNNLGEDDHNLSVRAGQTEYGRLDLAPGDSDTLTLDLAAGPYTLYCSLTGHEEQGMRADISVR